MTPDEERQTARAALDRGDARGALDALDQIDEAHRAELAIELATAYRLAGAAARVAPLVPLLREDDGSKDVALGFVAESDGELPEAIAAYGRVRLTRATPNTRFAAALACARLDASGAALEDLDNRREEHAAVPDAGALVDALRLRRCVRVGAIADARVIQRRLEDVTALEARVALADLDAALGRSEAAYSRWLPLRDDAAALGRVGVLAEVHLRLSRMTGRADLRFVHADHATELFGMLADRPGQARAAAAQAVVELVLGEYDEARETADEAIAAGHAAGVPEAMVEGEIVLGVLAARQDETELATTTLRRALEQARAHHLVALELHALAELAEHDEVARLAAHYGLPVDIWGIA